MKTVRSLTLLALVATTLASSAVVIGTNITVDSNGDYLQNGAPPDGTAADSLASVKFYNSVTGNAGIGNSNDPESNYNLLVAVLENWNTTNDNDNQLPSVIFPDPFPAGNKVDIPAANSGSYTTLANYDYVVFHFGTGQAGQGGTGDNDDENGWWAVWYLGRESKEFKAVPREGTNPLENVGGFSTATYFNGTPPDNRVPDGGTTITSLGVALLGLGGLRRLIKKD